MAMTNTSALATPAITRSASQPKTLPVNAMAARLTTSTTSDTRHAVIDRDSRDEHAPATAPAR